MTAWGIRLSFAGLPFGENTEHAFVHGFELGALYEKMTAGAVAEIEQTVHTINLEAIRRACAAEGWSMTEDACTADGQAIEGWTNVKLTKAAAAKHNPRGIRVIR